MAILAIKGHPTRGKEVIEILEMLGGKNVTNYDGRNTKSFYFINNIIICSSYGSGKLLGIDCYTLEQFLEKFPYKVGDKVIAYAEGCLAQFTIQNIRWNYELNKVEYKICSSWCDTSLMIPYKEETMEEKGDKAKAPNLIGEDYSGKRFGYKIPNGYEFDCIKNNEIILKPKQPQYPKTYDECCKIMGIEYPVVGGKPDGLSASTYRITEIRPFIYLIICRDAYWKIAGWNPKVKSDVFYMHTLPSYLRDLFPMPTEEMRDAFYENFKDLIEQCKELL